MSHDAGMNIAEVEQLAALLKRSSQELHGVVTELEKIVGNAAWVGPVSSRFKQQWWPKHRGQLTAASGALAQFGDVARANAQEQRRASDAGTAVGSALLPPLLPSPVVPSEIVTGTPAEVSTWWAGLSEAERQRFIRENPQMIGNLDGVAPEDRFAANRLAMEQRLEYLRQQASQTDPLASAATGVLGTQHSNPSSPYDAEIGRLENFLKGDRKFLVFDPSGDGRIAEVHGDLSKAVNVVVFVPGVSNTLANFDAQTGAQGQRLYEASHGGTAVIAWMGYDAPPGIEPEMVVDHSAASPDRAEQEAYRLVTFTQGLQATTPGQITVLGHSYGSVLATEAAKSGMVVDKVILAGSPGVPAANASVFNGAQVYAIANDYDPISNLPQQVKFDHSTSTPPTDPSFGATVLNGNGLDYPPAANGEINPLAPHSSYFDSNSAAITNIMAAAEGTRVTSDGYTVTQIRNSEGTVTEVYLPKF